MNACIFEYRYRDAGNWKTDGAVILSGQADTQLIETIHRSLESGELFIPEQVGLEPLQNKHLMNHQCSNDDDLDHAFHEFVGIRAINISNGVRHELSPITLESLADRFKAAMTQGWSVTLSPFGNR